MMFIVLLTSEIPGRLENVVVKICFSTHLIFRLLFRLLWSFLFCKRQTDSKFISSRVIVCKKNWPVYDKNVHLLKIGVIDVFFACFCATLSDLFGDVNGLESNCSSSSWSAASSSSSPVSSMLSIGINSAVSSSTSSSWSNAWGNT